MQNEKFRSNIMKNLKPEMIEKAKAVESAEELLAIAKANGVEMTADEAKTYFAQLNPKSGELDDDELDNVAGGCHEWGGNRLVVTVGYACEHWTCKKCGVESSEDFGGTWGHRCVEGGPITSPGGGLTCNSCKMMSYEKGVWYCNHNANRE
jgi:predicted ribosomally synthesized peptide with nif11-like leader